MKAKIKKNARIGVGLAVVLPLSACITVRPPDKPIEVNLNVTIRQEVLVRLQQDVQQMIQKNPQVFPPPPTKKQ